MSFVQTVQAVFDAQGALAHALKAYKPRPGQLRMAQAVAQTMQAGGALVVEAGTGIGKTYAYLVPALLGGTKVLVSTATKALQDQLYLRDIPFLQSILGTPVTVALLKGRASYLCTHRLQTARMDANPSDTSTLQQLARVEIWATQTQSGDLAEVDGMDSADPWVKAVTSTRDNCLGASCSHASTCFVNQARRQAMAADVVVVNHHLFFADLQVRESGVAELLPSVRTVVIDEAHHLNEIGVQFLGTQWTTGQLESFAVDVKKQGVAHACGVADWITLAEGMSQAARAVRDLWAGLEVSAKQAWDSRLTDAQSGAVLYAVKASLEPAITALAVAMDGSAQLRTLHARALHLLETLEVFLRDAAEDSVRWVDIGHEVRLVQSPLDIAASMQSRVVEPQADVPSGKSWIFTSATLGADAKLSWFVDSCGLQHAEVLRVESPFDYPAQASLFIPANFPPPNAAEHSVAVARFVCDAAVTLGGRTLVLTTSLRAMRTISACLRQLDTQGLEVLVQGQFAKRSLIDLFSAPSRPSALTPGCILVASVSFWEGIDMPEGALKLLVIDKLPFAPPDDPLHLARTRALEQQGINPFKNLHLPHAAVALKQGAGRLIRRETDQGILVVCDGRMASMGYGKQLAKALPPMARLHSYEEFVAKLNAITRPSTTDLLPSALP